MEQPNHVKKIKLVAGLGNPGKAYENTYHNAGLLFIGYLEKKLPPATYDLRPRLLKSEVHMNESGAWVKKILKKYNLKPGEILIAHDDSDVALGNFKLSFGRGPAGHKGIESVIETLGNNKFWRLRIGVRNPKNKNKAENFVLKKMGATDKKTIQGAMEKAVEELKL